MLSPRPALTNRTSCSSFSPRKNAVTGTWSASDSRASVARLGDAWAFSILDSMPLESPLSAASWPTVHPSCRRNSLTRAAIAVPSASSRSPPRLRRSGTGRTLECSARSVIPATTLLLTAETGHARHADRGDATTGSSHVSTRSRRGLSATGRLTAGAVPDDNVHLVKHRLLYINLACRSGRSVGDDVRTHRPPSQEPLSPAVPGRVADRDARGDDDEGPGLGRHRLLRRSPRSPPSPRSPRSDRGPGAGPGPALLAALR